MTPEQVAEWWKSASKEDKVKVLEAIPGVTCIHKGGLYYVYPRETYDDA